MKRILEFILRICIIAAFVISCKEPDDEPVDVDPVISYDTIAPEIGFWHTELTGYYSFEHYFINDRIYLIPIGERYNIELAEFSIDAAYQDISSFYVSEIKLDIKSAIPIEGGGFLAVGGIFNEAPIPYSNPFYKSNSPNFDIRIFDWNGRNNSFEGVTMYDNENEVGALFLARDEIGTIGGKYPLYKYSMVLTQHYNDSAYVSPFPIDSCYIDYYDKPFVYTERFVGLKIDAVTIDSDIVTHMFYFENSGGNLVEYNLGNIYSGSLEPEDIYYENANPLKIYRWSYKSNNVLILEKFSHTGDKEYSRDIKLFEDHPGMEAVCQVEKSADHQYCLIYGYFQQNRDPEPPVFKGNFLIKMDDEGNETDRVIWNEDFSGKYAGDQHIQDIGDNRYIFLYSFDFETDNDYFIFERIDLARDTIAR